MVRQLHSEDQNSFAKQLRSNILKLNPRIRSSCFRFVCASLLLSLLAVSQSFAKDTITITSEKTAVIDKTRGTAVWRDNVVVVRKSTGSTLITTQLSIEGYPNMSRLDWLEAAGKVKVIYYSSLADDHKKYAETKSGLLPLPDAVLTCDLATFSRKTALAELTGTVHIQSKDFALQAEKIRYDYHAERGKITAKVGEQVHFVFYKKVSRNEQQTSSEQPVRQKISGVADEILVNRSSRKIILQGEVLVIDHSDQSQFKAQRTELFFDEKKDIESVIANGNFSMNQPGRVSRSDRADFDYDKEEVTLTGNAFVKEDQKVEVTSARIKMFIKVNQGIIKGVDGVPVKMEIEID